MKADAIRKALAAEIETLRNEGSFGASDMLARFVRLASDSDLERFRAILLNAKPSP